MRWGRVERLAAVGVVAALGAGAAVWRFVPDAEGRARDPLRPEARWSTPVTGWPNAIAADGDLAVVVAGAGEVLALDAGDGEVQWRATVPGAAVVAPAVGPDAVVVSAGDRAVALDRATGTVRWTTPLAGPAAAVALAGEVVVATTEDGTVMALGVVDGRPRWSVAHAGALRAPPAVDRSTGVVVVMWQGESPTVRVLDLERGGERWSAPVEPYAAAPLVHGGHVYVAEGDGQRHAHVVARDLGTGQERWRTPVPASFESGIEPAAAGDDVVVVDHFGTVTALDATDGWLRWQTPLDQPVLRTRVLVAAEVVALTTYAGELAVLDRETGGIRNRWWLEGFPVAIALGEGASGDDGEALVALRLADPGRVESVRLH